MVNPGAEVRWVVRQWHSRRQHQSAAHSRGVPALGPVPSVLQETIDLARVPFGDLACPSPEGTLQEWIDSRFGFRGQRPSEPLRRRLTLLALAHRTPNLIPP